MVIARRIIYAIQQQSLQVLAVSAVFYVVLLIVGGAVFKAIEEPEEEAGFQELEAARNAFLKQINSNCNLTEADIDDFASTVLKFGRRNIAVYSRNVTEDDHNWNFAEALFFAGSMLTTLGYAQVTFLTGKGKVFAIFYLIFGIPFTLLILSAAVHRVNIWFIWQKKRLHRCFFTWSKTQIKLAHFFVVTVILVISLLIIPAAIFVRTEDGNWTFLDAFYFCFITLSTVAMTIDIPHGGPTNPNKLAYRVTIMIYLYVGLVMVLSALRLFSDLIAGDDDDEEDVDKADYHLDTSDQIELTDRTENARIKTPTTAVKPSQSYNSTFSNPIA